MSKNIQENFTELVELKYQLYNSLFLTLKFDAIEKTGNLLPLLQKASRKGLEKGDSPEEIIDKFFQNYRPEYSGKDRIAFLFNVIQYVERQIVLIDALEEAAYNSIHETGGPHSWKNILDRAESENNREKMAEFLKYFGIHVVLTAHPTQFYPSSVLAIIKDLKNAIAENKIGEIRDLLKQLGKTPFFKKQKPDPYDEALSLTDYLTNIFYSSIGELLDKIAAEFPDAVEINNHLITLGFWPGGDRDGNPYVTVDTTLKIAGKLRDTALNCYYNDIKQLKRRLSFSGVYEKLDGLENDLYEEITNKQGTCKLSLKHFLEELDEIEIILRNDHQGLFQDKLNSFRRKVKTFGLHMARIDIRQDSRVIRKTLESIMNEYSNIYPDDLFDKPDAEQIEILLKAKAEVDPAKFEDRVIKDTVQSFSVIREIQLLNGEAGCHRYIISNCRGPVDIAIVISLFRICGWGNDPVTVDIVPLFETIDDLRGADKSMEKIYGNKHYRYHLESRKNRQGVMVGFSDGTKDGGYLMANWAIYRAKEEISAVSRRHDVEVVFFDGRGGPPARGGGSSHLFYAALGKKIESKQIQITVQGQTINSHYGIKESAIHNLEYLRTTRLEKKLLESRDRELSDDHRELIEELAQSGFDAYRKFKEHPLFMPYLKERSPMKYYGKANIGSRPAKRGGGDEIKFDDLRAIPFVGAWSQLKQNVPGFFGVGTALKQQEDNGNLEKCRELYKNSAFFRALIANSMQSMSKTYFPLTRYLEKDEKFGEYRKIIYNEYSLSRKMILKVTNTEEFLEDNPRSRLSISLREDIVLPLLVIQQYALIKTQQLNEQDEPDEELLKIYEKMIIRTLFGNINAARNAA